MKKIFNYRPIVFIFIFFVLGVLSALGFWLKDYVMAGISITIFCFVSLFTFIFFKKLSITRVFCAVLLIVSLIGALSACLSGIKYSRVKVSENVNYSIAGRITQKLGLSKNNDYAMLLLEKVQVGAGKRKIAGNVLCLVKENYNFGFEVGEVISFNSKIQVNDVDDVCGNSNYRKNITAVVVANDYVVVDGQTKLNVFESIREKTFAFFYDNMNEESAGVLYAMVVGDTSYIDADINDAFRKTGIAHLLAISGLHIGFAVIIFTFILKKLRANAKVVFYVTSIALLFYAFLCGFTPSVTRAFIMATVSLFCVAYGKNYDGLCALVFSALIVLLFKPLYILDIGFLLSFCSVLSIFCLMPVFKHLLEKIMHQKLASSFALVISAQVGVLPLTLLFFDSISIVAIVVNLVLIPFASLIYMFTFVILIISFFFPFVAVCLNVSSYLMMYLIKVSFVISSLPFSNLKMQSNAIILLPFIAILLLCGDYALITKKSKQRVLVGAIVSIICMLIIFCFV